MTPLAALLAALLWMPASTHPTHLDTLAVSAHGLVSLSRPVPDSAVQASREDSVRSPSADTVVRRRPRAVEVSDAYELRLRIHRYASYTVIPLFLVQSVAGNQLFQADKSGELPPGWAKPTHSAGAAGLGTVFAINTVTGLWNLWDSRDNEVGRTKRWIHSLLLLGSDAGFTYAGIKLADDAKRSQSAREQHRRVAYISMGAALAGYGVMLVGDH